MQPIIFTPDMKERVWGGQKLRTVFGKDIPYEHTGESWEIACHDNGQSVAANGPFEGKTLRDILIEDGPSVIGKTFAQGDKFPLLIKLIDAKDDLSVQVHPDDAYAAVNENGELGKSEAWVVLEADPGASLVIGLKEGTTKASFKEALEAGKLETVLNQLEVKPGDVIDIPAGLLHAIGTGILLAEVQQNSDTTYRVYDWNRVGLDGKSRELHVDKSLETIDFEGLHSTKTTVGTVTSGEGYTHTHYVTNDYFALERVDVATTYTDDRQNDFEIFIVLEGEGVLEGDFEGLKVKKGDSLIIPYGTKAYTFEGSMGLLKTYVPN